MGLFNLSFLNRNFSYQKNFKITGFSSSFLMGLVFGFGWTPCIGPVLASVLTLASVKESLYEGALLLSVYSLGVGIPFILSSLAINKLIKKIKKYKRYIHLVERMMGLILALTGIGFIFGWVEQSAYFLVENLTFLSIFGI
jgi:cytochrome c-type biogenesis protein